MMKKLTLSTLLCLSAFSAPTFAVLGELSFSEQLQSQKQQLRPQAFNFFSDRYQQIKAKQTADTLSFKAQLDSQKSLLRKQEFNPISDAYLQMKAHRS